eukprot:CAMPEP_0176436818 /NCGR_PEP_ID=MMETSP0127-20121128/18216_1 /TAXON_ID=938130 /ORGANISM="Platyophrya macrostoma, Strain WH" /LENGTH=102 /DNA_ID=CAMNT_0017820253 /DNA_START=126 /DNA_END=431 /DNA_ORIENTATION=+
MNSVERFKAAWDETPATLLGCSRKEQMEWHYKAMYQLGLRDVNRWTKVRSVTNWIGAVLMAYWGLGTVGMAFFYFPATGSFPEHYKRENAREYARAHGGDVW